MRAISHRGGIEPPEGPPRHRLRNVAALLVAFAFAAGVLLGMWHFNTLPGPQAGAVSDATRP